ncbi:MAG: efflux RND transporter periplasmic adaptor subunit [Anaerolineae bacterium]|nr:efflux RND transporter periplasmic adaptor subunit [Anaerolineae bacterium]
MKRAIFTLSAFAAALALTACGMNPQPPATPTAIPTAGVPRQPTYTVQRGEIERKIEFLARIQAIEDQPLAFEVEGRVARVNVGIGDEVNAGDVLAELDTSDLKNQIEQARVEFLTSQLVLSRTLATFTETLQAAQLDLDIAELRLAQAQARNFGSAIELARAEIARAERALADANAGLTSARNIEADRDMIPGFERMVLDAQAALARARAEYERLLQEQTAHKFDISILAKEVERARLALARVQSSIDPNLERAVEVSRLTLERLEAQLGRAQIVAPFDGRVSSHSLTVGKTVRAFDPVIIISKPGGLEAAAELSQSRLVEIAVGQPVSVTLNSVPGKVYSGVVRRLPQAGAATTATDKSVRVTIEDADEDLKEGDLARVTIITARKPSALWLPPQAIRNFQGRRFVVVRDAEGERRADVKLGLQSDDRVEILSGVLEGQIVVAP